MLEALDLPFVQRGLAEVALLSVGAGLIGTWVVLRSLAFFSHAVGTAAFPGLVLAEGLGFAAPLGALGAAALFAAVLALATPRRGVADRGPETALALVGMLALGVILASDVFGSSAAVESLLFGSLLLVGTSDLVLAAAVSALAIAAAATLGPRWVAAGFDAGGDPRARSGRALDAALLGLIAAAVAASLVAVGALLVAALLVVPPAATRPWCSRMGSWQVATVSFSAAVGCAGVLLSVELNTPPGATIAVLAGALFALSALAAAARGRATARRGRLAIAAAAALSVFATLTLGGCGTGDGDADAGPSVVATIPVAADLARQVAGPHAQVVGLLDPSADPHDYEPRPDDVEALASADLVVASGGDLDAWIEGALRDAGADAELVTLAAGIPAPLTDADGELDPHWWHDPRNAVAAVGLLGARIAALDAESADAVTRRARSYRERILALDRAVARCLRAIPAERRKLVTDHDSFGYLARRYRLRVVGTVIPALTTEAQPSAGELAELREAIARERVGAIFPESASDRELANAIADETDARAGGVLYGDSLGPPGSPADTYLGMEAANARTLAAGLLGRANACAAELSSDGSAAG